MKCPNCGADVPVGDLFCGECGVYAVFEFNGMKDGMTYEAYWYLDGQEELYKSWEWSLDEKGTSWINIFDDDGLTPGNYEEEQLYLCRRDKDVPHLSLHPLVIAWQGDVLFLNESALERDIEYLSYQTGQVKRPDRLVEDFHEVFSGILAAAEAASPPSPPPATPYGRGLLAIEEEHWSEAIEWLSKVSSDDPNYDAAQSRVAEAQQQGEWAGQYQRALQALDAERWDEALAGFQTLKAAAGPGYRDVSNRIAVIREAQAKAQTMEKLYAQMEEAQAARQWDRILDLLDRIQELSPGYRGVDTLLEKYRHLEDLYRQAMTALVGHKWAAALTMLHQLQALEPDYRDLTTLLDRAQEGLDAEAALAQRYSRAQAAITLEDWAGAVTLLEEIVVQDDAYRDTAELLRQARKKLTVPCWNCGSPLPPGRKFCGKCGFPRQKPAAVVCPNCGHENPVGKKFCGKCGTRLAGG